MLDILNVNGSGFRQEVEKNLIVHEHNISQRITDCATFPLLEKF